MSSKRVIYIIGTGRSGTTLLEILIGNGHDIFNCGELNRYPNREGIPPQYPSGSEKLSFWQNIKEKLNIGTQAIQFQEKLHRKFEYHTGLLKKLSGVRDKKTYIEYQAFLRKFYATIFENIDSHTITDSSKYPGRALNLSETLSEDYEIGYIYIKRDPVKVVRSFAKKDVEQPPKSWLPANLYYLGVNTLCTIAVNKLKKRHKVVEVKYEDLINNPKKLLLQIQSSLDIDLSGAIEKVENNAPLSIGYLFDGNRIRLKNSLQLIPDNKPMKMSVLDNFTRALNYHLYH